jgi:hypothetical protein
MIEKEKQIDRKIIEEIAKEEAFKKLEAENKKKQYRETQIKIKEENDKKMKEKEEEKKREKILDKKLLDDYFRILENQEIMNKKILKENIKQQKNIPNEYFENVEIKKQEELEMELKYLKELEKIEKK